jgi:hypothetical protein
MYYTDDSLLPENQEKLMIKAGPWGPQWRPSPHISHWGSGERGSRLGSVVSMTRVQECHEAVSLGERGRRPSRSDVSGSVDCAVSGACQAAAFRNRA